MNYLNRDPYRCTVKYLLRDAAAAFRADPSYDGVRSRIKSVWGDIPSKRWGKRSILTRLRKWERQYKQKGGECP